MSNRLLSLFLLVLIFAGLYGAYYYFFVANVGKLSVIISGTDNVSVEITSEFKKSYAATCKKVCQFEDIPPVSYTLTAKKDGYVSIEKTVTIERGQAARLLIRMDREVTLKTLEEPTETPPADSTDTGTTNSGSQDAATITGNTITPVPVPTPLVSPASDTLSVPTIDGSQIDFDGKIYSIKNTLDRDTKIVTGDTGVFTYSVQTKTLTQNPLYDDILPLPSGDLITLVKKSSASKLSLLNLESTGNDYILLVNIATKDRKVLLQTREDGKYLEYQNKKVVLVDTDGKKYEVENAE